MLTSYLAPEGGYFLVGATIDHAANAFNGFADFLGRPALFSAFKAEVLDKMGNTSFSLSFIAAANTYEENHGDRVGMRHTAGTEAQTIIEGNFTVHSVRILLAAEG